MQQSTSNVTSAIEAYFNLMYNSDDSQFPTVFHDLCQVHGTRDGKLMVWSASEFRQLIRSRPSPASMGSPRQQEILRVEEIAPDMAAAKVRVRLGQTRFLDHLIVHPLDGRWLVTAKGFHIEQILRSGE
jgi:hypothetical protein